MSKIGKDKPESQVQHVIFTANLSLSPRLPLVRDGDTVTITFLSISGSTSPPIALPSFDDSTIEPPETRSVCLLVS